jgi:hypothetical protein
MGRPRRAARARTWLKKNQSQANQDATRPLLPPQQQSDDSSSAESASSQSTAATSIVSNDPPPLSMRGPSIPNSPSKASLVSQHTSPHSFAQAPFRPDNARSQTDSSLAFALPAMDITKQSPLEDVEMKPPQPSNTFAQQYHTPVDTTESEISLKSRLELYLQPYHLLSDLMSTELGSSSNLHALRLAISNVCDFAQMGSLRGAQHQGSSTSDEQRQRLSIMLVTALPILLEVSRSLLHKVASNTRRRSLSVTAQQPPLDRAFMGPESGGSYSALYEDFQDLVDHNTQLMMVDLELARLETLLDQIHSDELVTHFVTSTNHQRHNLMTLRASIRDAR